MRESTMSSVVCRRARAAAGGALLTIGTLLGAACSSDEVGLQRATHDASARGTGGVTADAGPSASGGASGSGAAGGSSTGGGSSGGVAGAATSSGGSIGSGGASSDAAAPDGTSPSHPPDGGSSDGSTADSYAEGGIVGASGGTVLGPQGASMTVPKGSLTSSVTFGIAEDATGAPSLPAGMLALGSVYAFTPHGTQFVKPVTVHIPFDAASVPSDVTPMLLRAEPGGAFTEIPAQVDGSTMVATVTSFSWFVVARDGTQGTLLVRIAPDPQSASKFPEGLRIRTGPAGSVYVTGQGIFGSTGSGGARSPCFVAKLTTTLDFEWVHQDDACDFLAVGPTGNVYFNDWDSTGNNQFLNSVNPSGAVRAGFPVSIPSSFSIHSILVDVQDNPQLVGNLTLGNYYYMTQVAFGSFTNSGKVAQAVGALGFGQPIGNDYTYTWAAVTNAVGLFFTGQYYDASGNLLGGFLQHFDSGGSAPAGFPVVDPNYVSETLVALPVTTDVVAVAPYKMTDGTRPVTMLRYHEDGTLASGFPHVLSTGNDRTMSSTGPACSDSQGNVYFIATLLPASGTADNNQYVLSYTADGAVRAGYPRLVGYPNAGQSASVIADIAVDGTGTLYFTGWYNNAAAGRLEVMIERLPAH